MPRQFVCAAKPQISTSANIRQKTKNVTAKLLCGSDAGDSNPVKEYFRNYKMNVHIKN